MLLHQDGTDEVTNLLVDLPEAGPMRQSIHALMKVCKLCALRVPKP